MIFYLVSQIEEKIRTLKLSGHVGFDSLPDQLVAKSTQNGFTFNILCIGMLIFEFIVFTVMYFDYFGYLFKDFLLLQITPILVYILFKMTLDVFPHYHQAHHFLMVFIQIVVIKKRYSLLENL